MNENPTIEVFSTDKVAPSSGPLSQAVRFGNLLFVSGQVGRSPKTGRIVDGFEQQATQTLQNLKTILEDSGVNMQCVLKATVYLTDVKHMGKMNEIYGRFFPGDKPSRTTCIVAGLNGGAEIEIDLIAAFIR